VKHYNLSELKALLPEYLRAIGTEVFMTSENQLTAACPIHRGVKRNFHAKLMPDGNWVWICRSGCGGDGGTTLHLHARLHGLDAKTIQCISGVAEALGIEPDKTRAIPMVSPEERAHRQRDHEEKAKAEAEARSLAGHLRGTLEQRLDWFAHHHHFADWRDALKGGSLVGLEGREHDAHLMASSLFHHEDVLWLGETYESGKEFHRDNFRPCSEWLASNYLPPRLAAGIFKAGSISRSAENVAKSPFIVIESDDLIGHTPTTDKEREQNKAMSFALFFYCQEVLKLHPRAVIDTGNKSLHLWFDRPEPAEFLALLELAEGLRIDKGLLKQCPFSPLRMPGTIHEKTNRPAELLFVNPIRPHHA
jgi:hypothetical protein